MNHGMDEKYGPHGGPYEPLSAIYDDVEAYKLDC
jgi:hypothetical protein